MQADLRCCQPETAGVFWSTSTSKGAQFVPFRDLDGIVFSTVRRPGGRRVIIPYINGKASDGEALDKSIMDHSL